MNAHEGTPRIGVHTPGPWHANYSSVRAENGNHIAQADDYGKGRDEQCANARLIAAAPDLLAALRSIADYKDTMGAEPADDAMRGIARAAIAKATGVQS